MPGIIALVLLFLSIQARATVRGYWPGNVGDLQVADHSGLGNNLTKSGSMPNPSLPTPPEGTLWLFQGPAGQYTYLAAPSGAYNSNNTNQISIWFYVQSTTTAASGILSVDGALDLSKHTGFSISGSAGTLQLNYTTGAGSNVSLTAATINDGVSHLVRFISSNTIGTQLYVDGVLQINDSNPSQFGSFQQMILGQETLLSINTTNNTYVDAVQIGDRASDAFLGPQAADTPTTTPTITTTDTSTWSPTQTSTTSPTPTWTPTTSPTPSLSNSFTASPTWTKTATITLTPSPTNSPVNTNTFTTSPTPSNTPIGTLTATPTGTPTFSFSPTVTPLATNTPNVPSSATGGIAMDTFGNVLLSGIVFKDGYVSAAVGSTHDVLHWYTRFAGAEVVGAGGNNENFSVQIQGSMDGTTWSRVATLSDVSPGDRTIAYSSTPYPQVALYYRSVLVSFTPGSTTGVTVLIMANQ